MREIGADGEEVSNIPNKGQELAKHQNLVVFWRHVCIFQNRKKKKPRLIAGLLKLDNQPDNITHFPVVQTILTEAEQKRRHACDIDQVLQLFKCGKP